MMKRSLVSKEDSSSSAGDETGENLMESMEGDYGAIPELDNYDENMLDHSDHDQIDPIARQAAEAEIDARGRQRRLSDQLDDFGQEDNIGRSSRRAFENNGLNKPAGDVPGGINLETMDMPLREWIAQDRTRREIKRRFRAFLEADEYHSRGIRSMCANNMASFEISYQNLSSHVPILAIWVADAPRDVIEIFDEVANELVLSSDFFPDYSKIRHEIHIRIRDLPIIDTLRDLRQNHLNQLVRVNGVVTRRSIVFPQLKMVHFKCLCCDVSLGPFRQNNTTEAVQYSV
jgi:DNA replication licensing factor MCM2